VTPPEFRRSRMAGGALQRAPLQGFVVLIGRGGGFRRRPPLSLANQKEGRGRLQAHTPPQSDRPKDSPPPTAPSTCPSSRTAPAYWSPSSRSPRRKGARAPAAGRGCTGAAGWPKTPGRWASARCGGGRNDGRRSGTGWWRPALPPGGPSTRRGR